MTQCTRCRAKSENFGCQRCANQLRTMLATLPDWIAELEFTAAGQGKVGEVVRRSPRYRRPLEGDAFPISAFPNDDEEKLARARHDRGEAVLRDALARGRVNARASELAVKVHGVLVMWVRDLCETRGIAFPTFNEPRVVDAGPNDGQAPWVDASTVHVAEGNPGELCGECWSYHNGSCS